MGDIRKDVAVETRNLKKAGLKVTAPRRKILHLLEKSPEQHFGAEEIYHQLKEIGEDIGLATVYRVLAQFEMVGLVTRHNFEGGHSVYELDQGVHHDHMVCIETGKVTEFYSKDIEELQQVIADQHGYELVEHRFVLYVQPKRDS
ncbi:MAG TPA: ferric iron uptake transcriptional regulator [Gammaproteobacteria bacterium]|jgi:Fur family ferric uptake transcriptional regulator|nr:ferric iron uptake transcriptional regulator [Gammaproteobacteria bacterium]MDP7661525.1 ferric iron uptake transcriptional regulator [Gammaproteobacteria bacterium]HJP38470.1 ferric iron uptake transcriptional regulator [Gammaproteobacteria bacterium]